MTPFISDKGIYPRCQRGYNQCRNEATKVERHPSEKARLFVQQRPHRSVKVLSPYVQVTIRPSEP